MMDDGMIQNRRVPPHSADAEASVLGGLMLRQDSLAKVIDLVSADDFYRRDHQLIYRAICELAEKKTPYDAVTLGEWFDSQGLGEQVGGGAYLVELASNTPSAANIVAYAEIVVDKAKQRRLIEIGTDAVNYGFMPEGRDTREIIAETQQKLLRLAGNVKVGGVSSMKQLASKWFEELHARFEKKSGMRGLPTPYAKLNKITGGFSPGDLVIVAGRPSMGKSAFAINITTANVLSGKRALFFNLEMTGVSIFNRCVSSVMDVPLAWLREPSMQSDDSDSYWSRVTEGVRRLRDAPLFIDDTPALDMRSIEARVRREHMRQPIDLLILDHLHLMALSGKKTEASEIGDITSTLKALGKELGFPVMLLAQLNRSVEARVNKRPIMSDLRDSGKIEQDADIIIFLYRDDYYAEQEGRPSAAPGMVEVIVSKNREGNTGRLFAKSRLDYALIEDYEGDFELPKEYEAAAEKSRKRWSSIGKKDAPW